jgi:hypothetical protein
MAAHDFDFNFGVWKTHIKRLQHPLTGSHTWFDYDGTSVVSRVWGGRASLLELEKPVRQGTSKASALGFITQTRTNGV